MRSHRYHLALKTNELVDFAIDGEIRHFAPGEIWEINNRRYHAVRNLGEEPRIHLIGYGPSASTIGANRAGQSAARQLRRLLRDDDARAA